MQEPASKVFGNRCPQSCHSSGLGICPDECACGAWASGAGDGGLPVAARPRAPQPGVEARQCPAALTQSASCLSSWWGASHLAQPWSPGVLTSAHLLQGRLRLSVWFIWELREADLFLLGLLRCQKDMHVLLNAIPITSS